MSLLIDIGKSDSKIVSLDLPTLTETRLLVQAMSGAGKSWLLRRLLEQSHGKIQQIVLDLEGEFHTLREKFDYMIAGKQGDIPCDIKSAGLLAKKLLEFSADCICDMSEMKAHERTRFVRLFLESLIEAPAGLRHPVLVVIDEAHQWCPEKGQAESAAAVIDLATRGRKRGLCAVLATQRLSKLHKDASAEMGNKLIGQTVQDIDRKRAAEELGFSTKEASLGLRKLRQGDFYLYGPAFRMAESRADDVVLVHVGSVQSRHPKIGSRHDYAATPEAKGKIKELLAKFVDLPAAAQKEAKTIEDLKREASELRRELTLAKKEQPTEAPCNYTEQIKELQEQARQLRADKKKVVEWLQYSAKTILDIQSKASSVVSYTELPHEKLRQAIEEMAKEVIEPPKPIYIDIEHKVTSTGLKEIRNSTVTTNGDLSGPEQRILNAIAWMESIGVYEPEQTAVAFLSGYTVGGGAFNNPRGSLNTKGLVKYRGKNISITDAGRQLAQAPDIALTTKELHDKIMERLPGPERRILQPLLDAYPEPLSQEELLEKSGYALGGAFNNPRGRLKTLGLIEYLGGGVVKARDILFWSE